MSRTLARLHKLALAPTPVLPAAPAAALPKYNLKIHKNYPVSPEEMGGWMRDFEQNTGENLRHVDVRGDAIRPLRDLGRLLTPRKIDDVPLWVARVLKPGRLAMRMFQAVRPEQASTYYPDSDHVYLPREEVTKGTLAHELGHHRDFNYSGVYKRRPLLGLRDAPLDNETLNEELAATMWAQRALGKEWKDHEKDLSAAYGTYIHGHSANPISAFMRPRTLGEWWRGEQKLQPYDTGANWAKEFAKDYQAAATPEERRRAWRRAMLVIDNNRPQGSTIRVDPTTRKFEAINPKDHGYLLARALLQAEAKRLAATQKAVAA